MKEVWWNELIDTRKTTIIHAGIFCGVLFLFILLSRIFKVDAYQIYMMISGLPDSLKLSVVYLHKMEVANSVRCMLLAESVLNIPVLFYAALLPVHIIGEEDENGIVAFICNGPFGRKDIFSGKLFACCTNYTLVVAVMFLTGVIMTAPGADFNHSLLVCARVFGMLLVMGLFLIHVVAFYCAVKSAYTRSRDVVFSWMVFNTVAGYFYLILMAAKDVFEAKGEVVELNGVIHLMFYALQRLSAVQLCSPGEVYVEFPWILITVFLSLLIIIGNLSGMIYEKKDFGWE